MVGRPPGVPVGAAAGVLAQPEPDRAAVEVPAEEGVEPLARDIRGDAECGGRGAGSPGRLPGRIVHADDGAVCDRGGGSSRGVSRGVGEVDRAGRPGAEARRDSPSRHRGMSVVVRHETPIRMSRGRRTAWKEVLDRRRYTNENQPLTVQGPGLLGNDSDADSDPLTSVVVAN